MAFLAPSSHGWRARVTTGLRPHTQEVPTFTGAVAALPPYYSGQIVSVALPTRLVIFERFTFPSLDRSELEGMVRLQLEKTLPYPVEETTHCFQILAPSRDPGAEFAEPGAAAAPESTVVVCVLHNPAVESFCMPLLHRRRFPERLSVWAMHVAAQAPAAGAACGLWQEEEEVVFAVFENGILSFTEMIASPDSLLDDFPQVLMGAELAGASTEFCAVLLDPALDRFREPIAGLLNAPFHELVFETLPVEGPIDLTLEAWRAELVRQEGRRKLKMRLATVGLAYAALLLLALAYLGILGRQLRSVQNELAAVQPQVDDVIARQARWRSLEAAIDQRRFTVELLYQVFQGLPSPEVRITQFDESPTQFTVEGEAPDASQAIQLGEKLKAEPTLNDFSFEAGQPTILANEHAQFRIFGKL